MQTKLEEMKELAQSFFQKADEFIAQMDKPITNGRWKPRVDDWYWFIKDTGELCTNFWSEREIDIYRFNNLNCFQTEQEAEQHLENIKTNNMLRALAEELNGNETIDWENKSQIKYELQLDLDNKLRQLPVYCRFVGGVYCLDDSFKDIAIRKIGEDKLIEMIKSGV